MDKKRTSLRLSATALRDYQFCGQYYRYRRVHRIQPTGKTPLYLATGTLLHHAYYYAHADPVQEGRRVGWKLTGKYDPDRARKMFRALWLDTPEPLKGAEQAEAHWTVLMADKTPWRDIHIGTGQRKAQKDPDPDVRKAAWLDVYLEMLEAALAVELPGKIVDIERRVEYDLGGIPFLGFIDLVCEVEGGEAYLDIKTGVNAPNEAELPYNPQMQLYYLDGPEVIYLWHFKSGLHRIERNAPLIGSLERSAAMTVDMIEAGIFLPRSDSKCGECVFRAQCLGE